ncbi:hypothetical protein [Caryophanon latum]|uniref:Uncharacterized protein n=1 Tax=Caryophanon latum TaxID=33977 RepID=A0A1C0YV91_9BACL|nr:hypothetical protein [Caryophanon latum]OCS91062.1 hypothetical protein A6K76_09975 [Caryophanon latum]
MKPNEYVLNRIKVLLQEQGKSYQHDPIFEWIDALYEEVYIHQMILDELLNVSARNKVTQYIEDGSIQLF